MKTPTKVQNFASLSMIYDRNALLVLSVFTFSENKLVAWVVLVAGFVQQTFFPTTKINHFCFIFNLLAPGSDQKFSEERTRSNLTRLGLNPSNLFCTFLTNAASGQIKNLGKTKNNLFPNRN